MAINNIGLKIHRAFNFGDCKIKITKDKKVVNLGKVELIEHVNGNIYNGSYMKLDALKQTVYGCFYHDNNLIGPRINFSNNGFEYCFSDGKNSIDGFRVLAIKDKVYIGYYDNGTFTGKMIVLHPDKSIYFAKASSFDKICETTKVKFESNITNFPIRDRKVLFENQYHDNNNTTPIIYTWTDSRNIYGKGLMRCEHLHDDFNVNSLEDINYTNKTGFGIYPYNESSFLFGFIDRFKTKGTKSLGFYGPCILKNKMYNYSLGFYQNDLKNDICLNVDLENYKNEIACYKDGKRFGPSIVICGDELKVSHFLNNLNLSFDIIINSNMDIFKVLNDNAFEEDFYPYEIEKKEIIEETLSNEDHDFNKAIENVMPRIKQEFVDFKYKVDFEKKVKNGIVYAIPKVTILEYIGNFFVVVIPKDTVNIDRKAFSNFNKNVSSIKRIIFKTEKMSSIENETFKYCNNLETIVFENNCSISKISELAFNTTAMKFVDLPKNILNTQYHSFFYCKNLKKAYVPCCCKIEEESFPPNCAIIYKDAITKQDEKMMEEKNKVAKKLVRKNEKEEKKNKVKTPKIKKEKEVFEKKVKKSSDVFDDIKEFLADDIFGNILRALIFVLQIILYVPMIILKPIISIFRKSDDLENGNAISIFLVILSVVVLILGVCDLLMPIHDGFSELVNTHIPSLFGFRLTKAYSILVNNVKESSTFWGVILTILYAIVGVFNFILNIFVLILVIFGYLLYIIYGFTFIYGFGGVVFLSSLIVSIKSDKKVVPIICSIILAALAVVYYLMFSTFYMVG